MNVYSSLLDAVDQEYEPVRLLKKSERGTVSVVRHKKSGTWYVFRRFAGNGEVYGKLLTVSSPNLPQIYEVEEVDGETAVLEEYIQGDSLAYLLAGDILDAKTARSVVLQVCSALWALHSLGVVHRDVKPENVMLRGREAVLIDFDASRVFKQERETDTQILGTTGYAAPEQYGISQSDSRADIYSLGVLLNIMLTGQHPSQKLAAGRMGRIVQKCTMTNQQKRYKDVLHLMEALGGAERGETSMSKKCLHCGAELAENASFCPHCEKPQVEKQPVRPPRLWRRKLLLAVLVVAVLGAAALAGVLIYNRSRGPETFEGGAQVSYTDRDGTYSLQLCFSLGIAAAREAQDSVNVTAGIGDLFALPSQLTIYDEKTGADAQDAFLEKMESCTTEIIPEEGSRAMTISEPMIDPAFESAARVAHVNYSGDSGTNEVRWTIRMKNGDTIHLKQQVHVTLLEAVSFSPENAPMDTLEELNALLSRIDAEVSVDTIVNLYLPPVTYDGEVKLSGRTFNLYGGTDGERRTTFTKALTMQDISGSCTVTGIDFTGSGGTGFRSTVTVEVRECSFTGWDTGIEAANGAWVAPVACTFSGNGVGFHFDSATCGGRNHTFLGNVFEENGTAVLLSRVPENGLIHFTDCQFIGNDVDIDNHTEAPTDVEEATFFH